MEGWSYESIPIRYRAGYRTRVCYGHGDLAHTQPRHLAGFFNGPDIGMIDTRPVMTSVFILHKKRPKPCAHYSYPNCKIHPSRRSSRIGIYITALFATYKHKSYHGGSWR